MRVIDIREQEDCFDGSIMKEVFFDQEITESFIRFMGRKGELAYFPSFARPFFKVEVKGYYFLKGIENNKSLNLVLYRRNPGESLKLFLNSIKEFDLFSTQ